MVDGYTSLRIVLSPLDQTSKREGMIARNCSRSLVLYRAAAMPSQLVLNTLHLAPPLPQHQYVLLSSKANLRKVIDNCVIVNS